MTSGSTASTGLGFGYAGCNYPYVVLLGPAGSGKTTFVRKLVHPECLSDVDNKRVTKLSRPFWTYDGSMVICDTPGTYSEVDKFVQNFEQIAAALTFNPVSQILIVVKADNQMHCVVKTIAMYLTNLLQVTHDEKVLGVLVTNMDTVSNWYPEELRSLIQKKTKLDCILFCEKDTQKEVLLEEIRKRCIKTVYVSVFERSLRKSFDILIDDYKIDILWEISKSVLKFKDMKREFDEIRKDYRGQDEINLIFEFKSWMEDNVELALNKLAKSFTFHGHKAEIEEGLAITMRSQIGLILYDLRVDIAKSFVECKFDARRCPYCNEVWMKDTLEVYSEGLSMCGDKPSPLVDSYDQRFGVLGTYTFRTLSTTLYVLPTNDMGRCAGKQSSQSSGCGRSIIWKNMPQVELPVEFSNSKIINMTDPEAKPIKPSERVPTGNFEPNTADWDSSEKYVVMIGDVGVGKSTVVDKLTDKKVRKSDSALSVTRCSKPYWTYDNSMVVCDTPGSNSIQDQLEHNEHIASALNYKPVSRILIIVKADTRIANVMSVIDRYNERLLSLPEDIVGVLVTHMDTVSWTPEDLKPRIQEEFDMDCILFSSKHTNRETLLEDIKAVCSKPESVKVGEENFSQLFKINTKMVKILRETTKEVNEIKEMRAQFDRLTDDYDSKRKAVLFRHFQSWIESKISEAEVRFERSNNFTFKGKDEAKEKGYIASMASQMRVFLYGQLNEAECKNEHEVNADLKKFIFKWQNRKLDILERKTTKSKAHVSTKSSKGKNVTVRNEQKSTEIFDHPSDNKTARSTTLAKNRSLPPIASFKDKSKESSKIFAISGNQYPTANNEHNLVDKDINGGSHLNITNNEHSAGNKFTFTVGNQIPDVGSSKLSCADESSFTTTTRGGEDNLSDLKTEKDNIEDDDGEPDGVEMDGRPFFSFDVCVNLNQKTYYQTLYLVCKNGDLMIEQKGPKTMRIEKNDHEDKAIPQPDLSAESQDWENVTVNIAALVSTGVPESQVHDPSQAVTLKQQSKYGARSGPNHKTHSRKILPTDNRETKSTKPYGNHKSKKSFLSMFTKESPKHDQKETCPVRVKDRDDYLVIDVKEEVIDLLSFNINNKRSDTQFSKSKLRINLIPTLSGSETLNNKQGLSSNKALDSRNKFSSSSSTDLPQRNERDFKAAPEKLSSDNYSERLMHHRPMCRTTRI